ncbi:hypothetical protein MY11210_001037 [Beauveria gryllotalpidicola]
MHALAFLSLVASTALVTAQQEEYASFQPLSTFGTLQARQQQSCASVGGKTCGIYGCCPLGKRCRGDAPEPSTTDIGVARPTTGGDDEEDGDGETTTRAVESTTRRLTPVTPTNTPARTTVVSGDDETTSSRSIVATSRSTVATRSAAVATSTSGSSSVNGAGSESNGNSNSNGSGSSSTASSGGNTPQASSADVISVGLASLAGGFIAAIASLF